MRRSKSKPTKGTSRMENKDGIPLAETVKNNTKMGKLLKQIFE